jgi:hypothetical protein
VNFQNFIYELKKVLNYINLTEGSLGEKRTKTRFSLPYLTKLKKKLKSLKNEQKTNKAFFLR